MKTKKKYFLNYKTFFFVIILTKLVHNLEMILIENNYIIQSCKNYKSQKKKKKKYPDTIYMVKDMLTGNILK